MVRMGSRFKVGWRGVCGGGSLYRDLGDVWMGVFF